MRIFTLLFIFISSLHGLFGADPDVQSRIDFWQTKGVIIYYGCSVANVDEQAAAKVRINELRIIAQARNAPPSSSKDHPAVAENGDLRGADNDGDGRREPVHVSGYFHADGTYVREQYRALPSPSPAPAATPPSTVGAGSVPVQGYYRANGTYIAPYTRSAPGHGK